MSRVATSPLTGICVLYNVHIYDITNRWELGFLSGAPNGDFVQAWRGEFSKLYIDGSWVDPLSTETIAVLSPYTEKDIAEIPSASMGDLNRAVEAARQAFDDGPWPRMPLEGRIEVLRRASAALEEGQEQLASLITGEMGCPITDSMILQAEGPRTLLDNFLELAPQYPWSTVRRAGNGQALVTRGPKGVVAAVVPWNTPALTTMIKIAPALLSGCSVVLKPAPDAPLSAYFLAEILHAAGVPKGVFNVLPAHREVSEALVTHPMVDKVSFTGSTAAGRRIASLCGNDLRSVTLELGGKSAAVILEDADLDLVMRNIRTRSLRNTGQICSNKTRILVPESLASELNSRLVEMVDNLHVGDPFDPATDIGPVVSAAQQARVQSYIHAGKADGAHLLTEGRIPTETGPGFFVRPTIFTEVKPSMKIAQEEIFGPVLAVLTYRSESEAIALANDSDYGLNGSVFSQDEQHALDVASHIHTGVVEINGGPVGWQAPVGGVKSSGIGREAGLEGFDAYVELKSYGVSQELADNLSAGTAKAPTRHK